MSITLKGLTSSPVAAGVALGLIMCPVVVADNMASESQQVQPAAHHEVRDLPNWVTRPCHEEDSVNCRWIATGPRHQGNGRGHTFIVRQVPGKARMVCVFYVQPRYARHHDYCEATR